MANKTKKIISVILAMLVSLSAVTLMASCGGGKNKDGRVYYLNFKPEQDDEWQKLAKLYTEKTGIPVTVLTASDNQYENPLLPKWIKAKRLPCFRSTGRRDLLSGRMIVTIFQALSFISS